jgi:chaperonin GroES
VPDTSAQPEKTVPSEKKAGPDKKAPPDKKAGPDHIALPDKNGKVDETLPVKLLHDRLLVEEENAGERKSSGGILIPVTAQVGKRLAWARVAAVGQNVRTVVIGDRVLYEPEDKSEVELHGRTYVLLRERDVHAVASTRVGEGGTGLYL